MINKVRKVIADERLGVPILIVLGVGANFSKEMLIAYYYGASEVVDIFKIATSIPNSFFQSLGAVYAGLYLPYVLDASAIRTFIHTRKVMLVSIAIMLIGAPLSFFYPFIFAPGMNEDLGYKLVTQGLLCWIGFGFLIFTFQRRIWLQAHNKKNVVSATSFINSAVFIIATLVIINFTDANEWVLISSFVVSGIVIFIVYNVASAKEVTVLMQMSILFKCRPKDRISYNVIIIAVLFHVTQLVPRIIDRSYASYGGEGAVSHLEYAYNFYTALGMVVGTSVVIILSRHIAEAKNISSLNLRKLYNKSRIFIVISIFGSLSVVLFAEDIVSLVFLRGEFDRYDMMATSELLKYIIVGVPIVVVNMLLIQVLYTYGAVFILIISALIKLGVKIVSIELLSNYRYESMFGISNFVCELCFFLVIVFMLRMRSIENT